GEADARQAEAGLQAPLRLDAAIEDAGAPGGGLHVDAEGRRVGRHVVGQAQGPFVERQRGGHVRFSFRVMSPMRVIYRPKSQRSRPAVRRSSASRPSSTVRAWLRSVRIGLPASMTAPGCGTSAKVGMTSTPGNEAAQERQVPRSGKRSGARAKRIALPMTP